MPELPEVQTVVDTLAPAVLGRRIVRVELRRADILVPAGFDLAGHLLGQRIAAVDRRGKRIVVRLGDGNRFYIHLGMTGRLTIEDAEATRQRHEHLVIGFEGSSRKSEMRFRDPRRFGGVWWLGLDASSDQAMGPEPLGLRSAKLGKRLARTSRAIKNALLDQSVIAGLGNIYVDESLFKAGIHPLTPGNTLSVEQVSKLNRAIKSVLKKALRHRGSTLRDYFDSNGNPGGFQKLHAVYDRAKLPCRKCKRPIDRIVLGGRSTHFCGHCQSRT
jgi:formamidopyrimidine-DNA glycosylase